MASLIGGDSDRHLFGTSMPGAGAIHSISFETHERAARRRQFSPFRCSSPDVVNFKRNSNGTWFAAVVPEMPRLAQRRGRPVEGNPRHVELRLEIGGATEENGSRLTPLASKLYRRSVTGSRNTWLNSSEVRRHGG